MPSAPKQWGKKRETRHVNRNVTDRRKEYRKKDWRKLREEVLIRDGMVCQSCGAIITEKGKAHVDHIEEISLPEEVVCDIDKLQTLCASCHSRKTRVSMNHGRRVVVTGPPNSGKTTYVKRHKKQGATAWDADDIVKVMCGADRHNWPTHMIGAIPAMLDGFVKSMQMNDCSELWIIVTDESRAAEIARRLGAEVVKMASRE